MKSPFIFALSLGIGLASLPGCDRPAAPPTPATPAQAQAQAPATTATPAPSTATTASTAAPATTNAPAMVLITGGKFLMGDPAEVDAPPHEVVVHSFLMDRHLVTQEHYQKVTGANPSRWKGDKNPVEQLRWADALAYCNLRSEREGLTPCYNLKSEQCNFEANGYRLPTEAEWEYACRAGTTTAYFFGDTPAKIGTYAWHDKNADGHPHPVGQKQPNPWGLYDMTGNVWEWCNDNYQVDYYASSPRENPHGPPTGANKVLRGGAWRFSADNCRSGYRYNESPGSADVCFGYDIYGFRCVRQAPAAAAGH